MSKLYHIQLKSQVSRHIDATGSLSYPLELATILPEADMQGLFEQALLDQGWEKQPDGTLTTVGPAGELLTADLENKTVQALLGVEKEVLKEVEVNEQVDALNHADAQHQGRHLLENARQKVDAELAALDEKLRQQVQQQLLDSESQRLRLLHEAVQQTYAEALKQKAAQLGDITSIHESTGENGNYELVIKVNQS